MTDEQTDPSDPSARVGEASPGHLGAQSDPLAKSRIAAGVFGIVLGGLGVHRFYLGYTAIGVAQIVVTLATLGLGWVWGIIEGILILTKDRRFLTDAAGRPLTD